MESAVRISNLPENGYALRPRCVDRGRVTVSENAPWVGEARARAACADSGVVGLQALVPPGAWVTLQDGEKVPLG